MNPINRVIHAIPEGAEVTIRLSNGHCLTGTDDTSGDEAEVGLFALFADAASGVKGEFTRHVVLAEQVVGFSMTYSEA